MSTTTTERVPAPVLDFDGLRELARLATGKWDVGYRVNPSRARTGQVAYFDQPSPAFYYLSPQGFLQSERAKLTARYGNTYGYFYLDPLVGKLLRNAGYLSFATRARGLERTLADLDTEAAKHSPDELAAIRETEIDRMAQQARDNARGSLAYAVTKLLGVQELAAVAGVELPDLWQAAERAAKVLDDSER